MPTDRLMGTSNAMLHQLKIVISGLVYTRAPLS